MNNLVYGQQILKTEIYIYITVAIFLTLVSAIWYDT